MSRHSTITRRGLMTTMAGAALGPAAAQTGGDRFVGITVLPEYIQNETVAGVLDNLINRARATAVAISPYVMEPADEKTGNREPPIDADAGKVRLLDRPLWGRRELFVRTAPSFVPDTRLYRGLRYQPSEATDLTRKQGPVISEFIRAAHDRGLKVYFQVQAAIPPGYRVQFGGPVEEDRPRLPNGAMMTRRVANNGSLASPQIRHYTNALIRDLCRVYPDIDGIRVDWPEYPPYFLDDVFLDFSRHCKAAAQRLGIDFERMRRDVGAFYELLHGQLTNRQLERWMADDGGRFGLLSLVAEWPGVADFLHFKATLVEELLTRFRETLTSAAGAGKELMPNAFPPPLTIPSGMDFGRVAKVSSAISVKLYTMHWPMMFRFYGDVLMKSNPGLSEELLVAALNRWFDFADGGAPARLSDYRYPEPEDADTAGQQAQARKIRQSRAAAGDTPIYALAHGYGPVADVRRRVQTVYEAAGRKLWVNRYGYLSDAKLEAIGEVSR